MGQLARRLRARLDAARTVRLAGRRGRQYEITFSWKGAEVRERITFVLRGRREYQLLCRWPADEAEPVACGLLLQSFRLA